jgi:hypothetical protein
MLGMRYLAKEPAAVQSPSANEQYSSEERDGIEEADRLGIRPDVQLPF